MFELYDDGRAVNNEETVEERKIEEEGIMGAAVERLLYETTVARKTDEVADTNGTAKALVVARFVSSLSTSCVVLERLTAHILLIF
jgi:hypothetical protein